MIDIRNFKDGKHLVVHTDDNSVYRDLSKAKRCLWTVPYYQEQKGIMKVVGMDMYFALKSKAWLLKKTGVKAVSK